MEGYPSFQATRAFVVLAVVTGAVSSIYGFVAHAVGSTRIAPVVWSAVTVVLGLIAMAVFAGIDRYARARVRMHVLDPVDVHPRRGYKNGAL